MSLGLRLDNPACDWCERNLGLPTPRSGFLFITRLVDATLKATEYIVLIIYNYQLTTQESRRCQHVKLYEGRRPLVLRKERTICYLFRNAPIDITGVNLSLSVSYRVILARSEWEEGPPYRPYPLL
jgi:hypothetical protein